MTEKSGQNSHLKCVFYDGVACLVSAFGFMGFSGLF